MLKQSRKRPIKTRMRYGKPEAQARFKLHNYRGDFSPLSLKSLLFIWVHNTKLSFEWVLFGKMLILLIFNISQGSKWKHLFYSSNKIRWKCYISAKDTNVFVERKISSEECNLTRKWMHPWQRIMRLWQQNVLKNGDLEDAVFTGSESVHLSRVLCSRNQSNPEERWRGEIPQAGKVIFHSQGFECTVRERIIQEIYFWSVETQEVGKSFACFSHFSFPSFSAVEVVKVVCAEKLRASVNTWNSRCEGLSWFYKVTCWRSWALLASKHSQMTLCNKNRVRKVPVTPERSPPTLHGSEIIWRWGWTNDKFVGINNFVLCWCKLKENLCLRVVLWCKKEGQYMSLVQLQ